ncbi:MAG: transglutaminase family protein [Dehalococcoidia bacterium]
MRIYLGCKLGFDFPAPTPMITTLTVHSTRFFDLEVPDYLVTSPAVPIDGYRDSFGNWCNRLVAPAGHLVLGTSGLIHDDGVSDSVDLNAVQHPVQDLPAETLLFLLPSRYCDTDILSDEAWRLFGHLPPGWNRVQAICDFVHNHITFGYGHARATRTASEGYAERTGVCRDFAHLAATFCRCLNIPTRYCTGYITDIGPIRPFEPNDFAAWIEVFLGGRWHTFDPRNNTRRMGRILMATGRDAADVPLTHMFGAGVLSDFHVWAEEAPPDFTLPAQPLTHH